MLRTSTGGVNQQPQNTSRHRLTITIDSRSNIMYNPDMFHHNSAGTYMDNNRKTVEKCRECIQENAGFLYSNNI